MAGSTVRDLLVPAARFCTTVNLRGGESVLLRLLQEGDRHALGRYFRSLSAATRRMYAPHPFDQETADKLCSGQDSADAARWVAISRDESSPAIRAYIIVRFGAGPAERERYVRYGLQLDARRTCALAPSVADADQGRGMGTALMAPILQWLRELEFRTLVLSGGVRAENARAKRFYAKLGFRRVGDFSTAGGVANHDMMLDLAPDLLPPDRSPHRIPA